MPSSTLTPQNGGSAVTFISLKGFAQSLGMVVQDISRPGVDGHAYRQDALRGKIFEMLGIRDYTDFNAATGDADALVAQQGSLADIVDDYGAPVPNAMLLEVHLVGLTPVIAAQGGLEGTNATCVQTMRFVLQMTQPADS